MHSCALVGVDDPGAVVNEDAVVYTVVFVPTPCTFRESPDVIDTNTLRVNAVVEDVDGMSQNIRLPGISVKPNPEFNTARIMAFCEPPVPSTVADIVTKYTPVTAAVNTVSKEETLHPFANSKTGMDKSCQTGGVSPRPIC